MGTTPVCTIDATGIHRPTLATILAWATTQFQTIYGNDIYLGSDSQDGELVGLLASAIDDANAMAVQTYNAFPPSTAQGVGLSSVVKINGLSRLMPSYSTAQILVVGVAGTTVVNGLLSDESGNTWALPATVVIPNAGQVIATATCQTPGAITAPPGTISGIENTQPGWQSASNPAAAAPGNPVESDATLRVRQSNSTMNSSTAILQGLQGALESLAGVGRVRVYENETGAIDANGIPGHCIAAVVEGGSATAIAAMIKAKKGGCGTYGNIIQSVTDAYGIPTNVGLFALSKPTVTAAISIRQLNSFTNDNIGAIKTSVANWVSARGIGVNVQWNRLYAAAYLFGASQGQTYEVVSMAVARDGATPTPADIAILFYEAANCVPDNVTVTVIP